MAHGALADRQQQETESVHGNFIASLGVTQKSAWFMLHRLRLALKTKNWEKMGGPDSGPIEADEHLSAVNLRIATGMIRRKRQSTCVTAKGKWALNPTMLRNQDAPQRRPRCSV